MIKTKKNMSKVAPTVPEMPIDTTNMPTGQPELTEQEMRDELERGFEDVKIKNAALESNQIAIANQLKQLKLEILRELFNFLQKNGVDPNDLASINQFLQKLNEQDPDFVTLFELVLSGLSPDGQTPPTGGIETAPVAGTVGDMAGTMPNMAGTTPPVAPGTSVPPTSSTTPTAPATPPATTPTTPPAFMERFDNLRNRGII